MENTILGQLKGKTRVIVTHAIQYIKYADHVLIMDEGQIVKQGTYKDVQDTPLFLELQQTFNNKVDNLTKIIETKKKPIIQEISPKHSKKNEPKMLKDDDSVDNEEFKQIKKMFFEEDRSMGQVSLKLFIQVLNYLGGWSIFLGIFLLTLIFNLLNVFTIQYLLRWSKNLNVDDRWNKYAIFCSLMVGRCVFAYLRLITLYLVGVNVSIKIHAQMYYHIVHAKIHEFLDKVPLGRIINRFSSDIDMIDVGIFWRISSILLSACSLIVSSYVLCLNCTWASGLLVLVFLIIAFSLQRKYISAKRELVRLQSITKSPIVSTFSDIIKGLAEIRSKKLENYFMNQLRFRQNENLKNGVLMNGCNAWFNIRVSLSNIFIVQLPCYIYLIYMLTQNSDIERVIMVVLYSTNVTYDAVNFLQMYSDLETSFISVERCSNFAKIEPEPSYTNFAKEEKLMLNLGINNDLIKESEYIPPNEVSEYEIVKHGHIQFKDVSARYPSKQENV